MLIRYFLIPKSRDLVSHNHGISGLKNGPGSRDPGSRDCNPYMAHGESVLEKMLSAVSK